MLVHDSRDEKFTRLVIDWGKGMRMGPGSVRIDNGPVDIVIELDREGKFRSGGF